MIHNSETVAWYLQLRDYVQQKKKKKKKKEKKEDVSCYTVFTIRSSD